MLSIDDMVAAFGPDKSRPYQVLVGFETEVFLFDADLEPLSYAGAPGLREIFSWTAERLGGQAYPGEPPRKMRLKEGALISMEPGGQFEFASAPVGSFAEALDQFGEFCNLLEQIQAHFKVQAFFGGVTPLHNPDQIGLIIPSDRYKMMDTYFMGSGTMGRRMMRQSCSLQVTFDFRDRILGQQLLRAAQFAAPIVAGLYCHSPYLDGRRTEHRSNRVPIWANTDPSRCGVLKGFVDENYQFEDYVRRAIEAPMLFLETEQGLIDAKGMTFEEFNRDGFAGRQASIDDFLLHSSTIFTDVRLKQTVEVRTLDGQEPALVPSALALLCGLLMCEKARAATLDALHPLSTEDFEQVTDRISRQGLTATIGGRSTQALALDLIEVARRGLANCFPGENVGAHLEPLHSLVKAGKTPADVVIERFGDDPREWLAAGTAFLGCNQGLSLRG